MHKILLLSLLLTMLSPLVYATSIINNPLAVSSPTTHIHPVKKLNLGQPGTLFSSSLLLGQPEVWCLDCADLVINRDLATGRGWQEYEPPWVKSADFVFVRFSLSTLFNKIKR